MSAYELASLLCMTVEEAQDFIECCDAFDSDMEALYDLEERKRTIDDYDPDYLDSLLDDDHDFCGCR